MKQFFLGLILLIGINTMNVPTAAVITEDVTSNVTVNYMTEEEALKLKEQADKIGYDKEFSVEAFETDLAGNIKEVEPIGMKLLQRIPPKDGFVYVPYNYSHSTGSINHRFKSIGSFTLTNRSSTPINGTYTQQDTVTTNWSVSATISGSTKFKVKFIGEIEGKIAGGASYSKTTSKGTTYSAGGTVAPGKSINMFAYQKGGKSSGKLYWQKYSPSGSSLVGMYSETTPGGTAPISGITIDVTN